MDGPSMQAGFSGGGFEAGSTYVTVRADLAPLEADLARVPSMLAAAAQGGAIPVGGGMMGGGAGFTASPPMPVGGASLGGAGLPAAPSPIVAYGGAAGLPMAPSPFNVMLPMPFAPGFNPNQQPQPSPQPQPGSRGWLGAVRRASVAGSIMSIGLEGIIDEMNAEYAQDHPELSLYGMDHPGSAFNPFANSVTVNNALRRADINAIDDRIGFFGKIPIIGALLGPSAALGDLVNRDTGRFWKNTLGISSSSYAGRAIDWITDRQSSDERQREMEHLDRVDRLARYFSDQSYEVAGGLAAASGNLVASASLRASHSRSIAENDLRRARQENNPELVSQAKSILAATNTLGQYDVARASIEMGMQHEGLQARAAAADYQAAYMPASASALNAVARARHEVAMASPEMRADTIRANQHELRAQEQLLFGQRGGETAINMSMYEATGNLSLLGWDLSGRDRDRREAQRLLQNGAANLSNTPQVDPALVKALQDLVKKLTPVGVTMFKSS